MSYNSPNTGMYSGNSFGPSFGGSNGNNQLGINSDMTEMVCAVKSEFSGTLTGEELCGREPSNVASAQEVLDVSRIAGQAGRPWSLCYNVSTDLTATSQTFHAKCDNVGTAFVSFVHSLTHLHR